jgi:hypothetical protein
VTKEKVDSHTLCDILIIKVVGIPHERAVSEIKMQIGNYCRLQCGDSVIPSGWRYLYTVDGIGIKEEREPDATISSIGNNHH